jgi:DNA gyrase/topoisomerase IV subunit A
MMLIFPEDNLRAMGKAAGGVKSIELQSGDQVSKLFLYRGEPFVMVYGEQAAKLINIEDFKLWKRARAGQQVVMDVGGESVKGAISIVEGAVRMRMATGNVITKHSNDITLDDLQTPMEKLVSGSIDIVYRPREEKEENKRYSIKKSDTDDDKSPTSSEEQAPSLFQE